MPTSETPRTSLAGGLVLRTATPADLPQIAELLTDRGEPADAVDHRLVVEDPAAGWETCAVVVDGDRVLSTATLLDEELQLAVPGLDRPVLLPAGQVELVATVPDHEGQGLVRALMGWAHELSAARGHVLQVMIGIPYFYRLFGYSYAIDIPAHRPLVSPPSMPADHVVRPATRADLPAVQRLEAAAQEASDLRMPHSPPRWGWLVDRDGSTTWVVERSGDVRGRDDGSGAADVVATGRTTPPEEEVVLAELAAVDHDAARALVAHAHALAQSVDEPSPVTVWDRPGTVAGEVVAEVCGPAPAQAEQYYVRVPDAAVLLDPMRPALDARLASCGLEPPEEVLLGTFRQHLRIPVVDGRFGEPVVGGTLQAPGAHGGAAVAPDQLGPLLLGPLGMAGLARRHPDVYPGPHAELMEALFPPVTADLLTYYLP